MPKKTEPEIEIIDDVDQGTPEWRALRVGLPTASNFGDVMAAGEGKVRGLYLRKMAGEIITGLPAEDFRSRAMERGAEMEDSLRAAFQIETGLDPRQVAFVRRRRPYGIIGASPDALIGDDCGLEIKKAEPHVLIEILRAGRVPPEHVPQVQGNMLVSGRPWWWLAIGFPGMPMFKRKIARDSSYCARLEVALETFTQDLDEMVVWLRRYGRE
jgi:predicted phage-related endonuclease